MRAPVQIEGRRRPRWGSPLLWLAVFCAGCTSFHNSWDRVTSRDLPWSERLWGNNEPPLETIRISSDGARKGKALATLRDPGNPQKREEYLSILLRVVEPVPPPPARAPDPMQYEPLCVLGAVRALGTYKDDRAVEALVRVYQSRPTFPGEIQAVLRTQVLASLDETGSPQALPTLRIAAKQAASSGSSLERQQIADERLQAIRALRKHKDDGESLQLLVDLLEKEKDIAVRHRAHESLQAMTGRSLPPDAAAWREGLASGTTPPNPSLIERVMWWKRN